MNQPLLKKEIASAIGKSPRTLRRHRQQYAFLERCRTAAPGRPTYNRDLVQQALRARKMI